ncbi:two-component regulator propeller domain-containing protein [Pontibacter sp. 13R65]|uniref:two-component regulator propeller domain-containing protein n=1 Tax=Pontibacter sp. 13R65 TaxID=3127458 RepID=UPI00301CAFCB
MQYVGIEHGLSNNWVNTIYKDKYGFIWMGTDDGLNQYDGYGFKVFRKQLNDSTSIVHNQVSRIAEDSEGIFWVGTRRGACTFDNFSSTFKSAYYLPRQEQLKKKITSDILDINSSKQGTVLLSSIGLGLLLYDRQTDVFRQVPLKTPSGLKFPTTTSAIASDEQGNTWVMVEGQGLCSFNAESRQLTLLTDKIKNANIIKIDAERQLWLGTNNGLYKYNTTSHSYQFYGQAPGRLSAKRVLDLNFESPERLWIATDGGGINMLHLPTDQVTYMQADPQKKVLTSNAVSSLYRDGEGMFWIGTLRGGINILDKQKNKFRTIAHSFYNANSLVHDFVFSFAEEKDGTIWIGTDGGGISVWDRDKNTFRNFVHQANDPASLSANNITSILLDHENNIWASTYGGGINKYNRATRTFRRYTCGNDNLVWKLFQDSQHTLWAGTLQNGALYRYNPASDRFEVYDKTLTDVLTIAEDREGTLWLGTYNQLIKVDKARKAHKAYSIHYPVRDILEDRNGGFWIGTQGRGLLQFDRVNKHFLGFDESQGLANNTVLNLEEDKNGNFWISTYHGVTWYNPNTKKYKNFYESDGLQSNQFNYNASLHLSTGELLLGGIKGFNIFHPDSIKSHHTFPNLVTTSIRVLNQPISATQDAELKGTSLYYMEHIQLPYDKAYISVDFVALEFRAPDKISYAYMLEGWDKTWNYIDNLHTANYSNLREGNYTLRIKASNAEGVWNEKERVITLTVLPPWYRSWWAYTLYASVVAGFLYAYSRYKAKQTQLKYELDIARIKAEKETELNEKKLSFFTNVSHEFRTPLTLIISPLKELADNKRDHIGYQDLAVVYRNARRLLGLVDQLLLFRKADSEENCLHVARLSMYTVCEEVYLSFIHQAKTKNIKYSFSCENKAVEIFGDREKIEILLFNLVSNAFKFTPAGGEIELRLVELGKKVEITVQDSGCGIPPETGEKLFSKFHQVYGTGKATTGGFGIGLYLVKKFVESHQGEITYSSEPGKGTKFCVWLPTVPDQVPADVVGAEPSASSALLEELKVAAQPEEEQVLVEEVRQEPALENLISGKHSMLLIEDNTEIRQYIRQIFSSAFTVYEAENGEAGLALAQEYLPDIIISDIMMEVMDGLELCRKIKDNASLNHIPIILLTASSSSDFRLKGIEGGAVDYITKPFEKSLLIARVESVLKSRDNLQRFFYNKVTLKPTRHKISSEYSEFFDACVETIERHIDNSDFNVKMFAREMGMSHSNLYKRVKDISGRSVNDFIRFIRLRKVAKVLIDTDCKVNEAAFQAGFNDIKYFREQFYKLFGMNPSEYIKKYRKPFHKNYTLNEQVLKDEANAM